MAGLPLGFLCLLLLFLQSAHSSPFHRDATIPHRFPSYRIEQCHTTSPLEVYPSPNLEFQSTITTALLPRCSGLPKAWLSSREWSVYIVVYVKAETHGYPRADQKGTGAYKATASVVVRWRGSSARRKWRDCYFKHVPNHFLARCGLEEMTIVP